MPSTQILSREITLRADSTSRTGRSISATVATDSPVVVFDQRTTRPLRESLVMAGVDVPARVPMLTDHQRSIPSTIGSVDGFRIDGSRLRAHLRFAAGTPAADEAWALVDQGHIDSVSVGYRILEAEDLRPGERKTFSGRTFTAPPNEPLRVVTRWQLREVSLVPIGADTNAVIGRSYPSVSRSLSTMHGTTFDQQSERDIAQMTFPQLATAILRRSSAGVPENHRDACRAAFSSADGAAALAEIIHGGILAGFRAVPDSLAGVYRVVDAPNYLAGELAALSVHPRLYQVGRGDVAPAASFGLSSTGYRLARFGCQFVIDDQDFENVRRIGVYATALEEIGASVRRLVSDLLWSTILSNPDLGDGTALFHADRTNLSANPLSDTNLDTAMSAIASQVSETEEGDPVHLGLSPRYLVTPPSLYGLGRRLARDLDTGDGSPLVVRPESRLTAAGVLDPLSDEIVESNGTSWLLAAPGEQAPGLVLALLFGKAEPTIRTFALSQGQWGSGFDVSFSCAAAGVDGRSLYWSTGQ